MTEKRSTNITWHRGTVSPQDREGRNGHRGAVVWFTGLSGSGKSTLAHGVEEALFGRGCQVYVLDGDNIRHGLNQNLGFSDEDRTENIRRIGEVAKLFADAGVIVLTAFISPFRADRDGARAIAGDAFHEVYVDVPIEICEQRDPKGLYEKARAGDIPSFTGIDSPYEAPEHPELRVDTSALSPEASVASVLAHLETAGVIAKA